MPEKREEDARATGQVSPVEEVGSKARVRRTEGILLEAALALLRKKTKVEWTEQHRNVARKLVLEGCWVQKRLFDFGWSDESECQACYKEDGTEKHRLYDCPEWFEVRREIPEDFRESEQKTRTSKEWKWHRGTVTHPLSESQWNRGDFSFEEWESEKHKSWCMPAEGFKCNVATEGSLLGSISAKMITVTGLLFSNK